MSWIEGGINSSKYIGKCFSFRLLCTSSVSLSFIFALASTFCECKIEMVVIQFLNRGESTDSTKSSE